MNHACCSIKA